MTERTGFSPVPDGEGLPNYDQQSPSFAENDVSFDSILHAAQERYARAGQGSLRPELPEERERAVGDNIEDLIAAAQNHELLQQRGISVAARVQAQEELEQFASRQDSDYPEVRRPNVYEIPTPERVTAKAQELIDSIDNRVESFYEGTQEVYKLGTLPTVMFKPRDDNPSTAMELIANLKQEKWIVFYTDGTIVSIPPTMESMQSILQRSWQLCYIGIGLPKGYNQGTAEPNSSGLIRSSDPSGKDKRVYSDIGFSAAIAARRGLSRDMKLRRKHQGDTQPRFFAYSMADQDLPIPHSAPNRSVVKRKAHYYVGKDVFDPRMAQAFDGVSPEYFETVRARADYPLSLDRFHWRDISGFAECIVDTIDSTNDVYTKPLAETEYRLRVTTALFRSFQTITEEFWHYVYGKAYKDKHPNPEARKNAIGYQIYGESIKLQFEDFPDAMVGDMPAVKYLNAFIEKAVQRMDKILKTVCDKRLQPSLLRHPNYSYNFNGSDNTDHSYNGLMNKLDEYLRDYQKKNSRNISAEEYKRILRDVLQRTTFMYNGYIQSSPHIDDDYETAAADMAKQFIALNQQYNTREEDARFSTDVYLITDDFFKLIAPPNKKNSRRRANKV